MKIKVDLINYFDVWGNKEEGYEVNNLCKEGTLEIPEKYNEEIVTQALIDFGFLKDTVTSDMIEFDWHYDSIIVELYEKDSGCPIGRLEESITY